MAVTLVDQGTTAPAVFAAVGPGIAAKVEAADLVGILFAIVADQGTSKKKAAAVVVEQPQPAPLSPLPQPRPILPQ